jgi:hypothetical protein
LVLILRGNTRKIIEGSIDERIEVLDLARVNVRRVLKQKGRLCKIWRSFLGFVHGITMVFIQVSNNILKIVFKTIRGEGA